MPQSNNFNFARKFYYYLGLFPDYNENFTTYKVNYIKVTIIVLLIIAAFITREILGDGLDDTDSARYYLRLGASMVNIFLILVCIIRLSMKPAELLRQIFMGFEEIIDGFQQFKQNLTIVNCKWFVGAFMILFAALNASGLYSFSKFGLRTILIGGIDQHAIMYVGYMNALLMHLLVNVKLSFSKLNLVLEEITLPQSQPNCLSLDILIVLHNKLCNICGLIQDIFGWQIMLYYLNMMLFILGTLQFAMSTTCISKDMAISLYTMMGFFVAHGIILAKICNAVSQEGKKTTSLICDFINVHNHSGSVIMNKAGHFLQQSIVKSPVFTAASFFVVDNSMIFMFVNLTATYIIVLIQFRK